MSCKKKSSKPSKEMIKRYCQGGKLPSKITFKRAYGGYTTGLATKDAINSVPNNTFDANALSSTVGKTSQVGGLAGTISSTIGIVTDPIRAKSEELSESGDFKSTKSAKQHAFVNYMFDPARGLSETFQDKNASNKEKWLAAGNMLFPFLSGELADARYDRLRKDNMSRVRAQRLANLPEVQSNSPAYAPVFEMGGILEDYKGASHANGGIPVNGSGSPISKTRTAPVAEVEGNEVNWNQYIFSDKLFI